MINCTCKLNITDGNSYVIVDSDPCMNHKNKSLAETFRLRTWIIDEGMLYNSYREDTGTEVEHGLIFKDSPWHNNQFVCDLSSYLQKFSHELLVGVNLFADGVLTNAQGRMRFKKAMTIEPEVLYQRMNATVKKYLA